ncbi:hypothetical protein J0A68_08515 [Algoriphagus sp. H41]|uniref:Uncharacterized protein n=1 Tax=Algoriphagus oliviformis TaxID=2811231 RepID=A0ABS3C1K7_9BACT|nr:hypothetical protein [Algoriphagus oliviformis]MBN7810995.1 hypothetical protein [Algoriphagus oliviformis]
MAKRFSCKLWLALALFFWMQFSFFSQSAWGQVDSVPEQYWDVSAVILAIFTPDQNFALPVAYINYKRWHLEPRYNYEDLHTFSTFVGYNFRGGERIRYLFTPMLGGVVGRTKGVAPGL